MFGHKFAVYLGTETQERFVGFIAEESLFLIIEIEGFTVEAGRTTVAYLKEHLIPNSIVRLSSFEENVIQVCKNANIPNSFSLAVCFVYKNVLYLKTMGGGIIYIARRNDFAKIIEKEQSASGYLKGDERFILTTSRFVEAAEGEHNIARVLTNRTPNQVIDELTPQLKGKDDNGMIALVLEFFKQEENGVTEQEKIPETGKIPLFTWIRESLKVKSQMIGTGKKVTFILVVIIAVILTWSVVFGVQRRTESEVQKKVKITGEIVALKLTQAEDVAFFNLSRSLVFIDEARQEVSKLKKETGNKKLQEITDIEELIKSKEALITKKEEKQYEEFFDLTIDSKGASGNKVYLDSGRLAILDRGKGVVYLLSIEKKSLEKLFAPQARTAKLVAVYKNEVLLYVEKEGIFKGEEKLKKVIDDDSSWSNISDMAIYNGNIYLLDSGKNEIYKYVVTDDGYSDKSSYFKTGQAVNLKGSNSISIDSSVYIGFSDSIRKFTAGLPENFETDFPNSVSTLYKVFTSQELGKVYVWDKEGGVIFVLSKNGVYERQIKSSILREGSDLVVFQNSAFILTKEKILKINVD